MINMLEIIATKRDDHELSTAQIQWFITEYTAGRIPDYQASALLMAILWRGLSRRETVDLTLAMAHSGDMLDLHDTVPFVVDKHSSGGVGDKTTLVVQPLVAACGVPVGKMSGRGLGPTGGTLDKMKAIRGWSDDVPMVQFKRQLVEIGLVLAGQTAVLAPADGKLYALRDATGTVANIGLIAASIMSKKLAGGADAILLDVKTGSGAFMTNVEEARRLARTMVDIGNDAGRKTVALLSDMNQPLGHAVGNALEVREAIACLQGGGPADFWAHCLEVAAQLLRLAKVTDDLEEAKARITAVRQNGAAWQKFRAMVAAQGGDLAQISNPALLPQAKLIVPLLAEEAGYLTAVDTAKIGWACVHLGAGRKRKEDPIDYAVGLMMPLKVGDSVAVGQTIATIYANDEAKLAEAQAEIRAALTWGGTAVPPLPHFYGVVG